MRRFVVIDKRLGETPLLAIQKWKMLNSKYVDIPASYAGRLDPMASGKLLVLLGNECKHQRTYTNLDKEYEIEVLLDVGSDTGDILGISEYAYKETSLEKEGLADAIHNELGAHARAYPIFSSKTVDGKPLFLHALEGTLTQIQIPEHIERIYNIKDQKSYSLPALKLATKVDDLLSFAPQTDELSKRLGEDFRISAVRAHWRSVFENMSERNFTVLRLRVTCASGTYMRSLAGRLGTSLHTKALALSIKRTKIGTYLPVGKTGFWLRTY